MRGLASAAAALAAVGLMGAAPQPTVLHISSHLPQAATVRIDNGPAVQAPGEGVVDVPMRAGRHTLHVTPAHGAPYNAFVNAAPMRLMHWHGRGYWCVNLLIRSIQTYSTAECREDVTDAG
jgi:hypothetical protein